MTTTLWQQSLVVTYYLSVFVRVCLANNLERYHMENSYIKYCPNVFLAKCEQEHKRGDIIQVQTKYGKENDSIVFNLVACKDGFYYYSVVRADGFNVQEWAKKKADKYQTYAANAEQRSTSWQEKSNEGRDFLVLAEPIKVGHHSEKHHRALIERNHNRMGHCVRESDKAEQYEHKARYWVNRIDIINLSMPESIEYFEFKLEQAKKYHADMKAGLVEKSHSMSLQYAKKSINEMQKNYDLSLKLWG